jgi:hypothetical protein
VYPCLLVTVACLCLTRATPVAQAQTFYSTSLREPADLDGSWLAPAGDDPNYARADFDDSHWTPVDPKKRLRIQFPNSSPEVV